MIDAPTIQSLYRYNTWANSRVFDAVSGLDQEAFTRDLGSSYPSVRDTLVHLVSAEWIWLERWKGISPSTMIDEGEFADIVELRDRWTVIEDHRESWFKALRPEALAANLKYRNVAGNEYEQPLWQLVQHVANHSTYHRGQIVLMLRQLGAKTVSTDLVLWDRDREARAKHYG